MSLVLMGSSSGSVTLQEPAVAGSTVLDLPATSGTVGLTTSQIGMKNRIINGNMVIDQRNNGASVTLNDSVFPVDRFRGSANITNKCSGQRSTVAPPGFSSSLLVTSTSAYSVGAGEIMSLFQAIEGVNVEDLAWGTANARTVTLSFWVRSSLTGTFGGALKNSASNRSYAFSYAISSANTWEQKSITIPGDTTGTWLTNNGVGIYVQFGLGVGSTFSGTAGSWSASNLVSATGAVSVIGTNGATWYITGVQLELGSAATTFDFRAYGTELALCQRYYWKFGLTSTEWRPANWIDSTSQYSASWDYPVTMRGVTTTTTGGFAYRAGSTFTNGSVAGTSPQTGMVRVSFSCPSAPNTSGYGALINLTTDTWAVSAEL